MNANQIEEKLLKPRAGIPVLVCDLVLLAASIFALIAGFGGGWLGAVLLILGAAAFIAVFIVLAGLKAVRPNEALVLTLFGNYYGTIKEPGYYFVNPFCASVSPAYDKAAAEKAKREKESGGNPSSTTQISSTRNRVSLKTMTLDNGRQKVNDVLGNPIIIGAVVIWHVENPTKAVFNVEDYPSFLSTQTDSTIRNIARLYPYDVFDEGEESDTATEKTLRGSSQEIAENMKLELQKRVSDAGIVVEEVNLALAPSAPAPEPTEPAAPPTLVKDADTLTVRLDDGEVTFDRATARLRAFVWQGRTLLADGPDLIATGVNLGAWQGRTLTAKTEGNRVLVSIEGSYACDLAVRFDLAFLADGRLEARYTLLSNPPKGAQPSEVGLAFALPGAEAVRWERAAFHSAYPADHIGRPRGVAHRVRPGSDISPDVYGSKPAWPWMDDMRTPFVYAKDDPNDGLATNDFKAMREAIRAYDVLLPGGGALRLRSDGKSQAARVAVSADRALIDDRDPRVRYSEGWAPYATPADHAGTETYSTRRDAWAELAFEGAGIRVIGAKQANVGLMRILVDGREVATVDTHSDLGSDLKQSVIHTVQGLAPGKHTVRVETAGGHADCVVVDAFEVLPAKGPRIATRLIVCDGWWYPGLAWGNYCGRRPAFAKGTSGKADLRPLPATPGGWSEETQPPTQGGSAAKSR